MFISCAVPNIKRNMANLSVKVAQLVANETKSSTYVDVDATINDDGVETKTKAPIEDATAKFGTNDG